MSPPKQVSGKQWMREHLQDEYVRRAQKEGYRARAIYKLQEIDERDRLIKPGMVVVDLGAAPGSWCEYVVPRVGENGRVFALDILPMNPVPGVEFIQGDFTEQAVLDQLLQALGGRQVDLVLSDMAPNISGIGVSDQARAMHLVELAMDLAEQVLRPGGSMLVKVFQGQGFPEFQKSLQRRFKSVRTRKPKASRARSREIYLLAQGFLGSQ
ncbi:MAG: 23S rRNA methyltransferase [Acidithiobacillales bacterium SG8_45]|nr:MAG: 23S rRNA methyltransferase [Acidithiobacillales bacterium SG8_45]